MFNGVDLHPAFKPSEAMKKTHLKQGVFTFDYLVELASCGHLLNKDVTFSLACFTESSPKKLRPKIEKI